MLFVLSPCTFHHPAVFKPQKAHWVTLFVMLSLENCRIICDVFSFYLTYTGIFYTVINGYLTYTGIFYTVINGYSFSGVCSIHASMVYPRNPSPSNQIFLISWGFSDNSIYICFKFRSELAKKENPMIKKTEVKVTRCDLCG